MSLQNRAETSCSCSICKEMCKTSPCFPNPAEARKLIDAGYSDKLTVSIYANQESETMHPAITAVFDKDKGCVFQNGQGLCELHDKGLKPMEGRLANHAMNDDGLRMSVCKTWANEEGLQAIGDFNEPDLAYKDFALFILKNQINYASRKL